MESVDVALKIFGLLNWTAICDCFYYSQLLNENIQTMTTKMEKLASREEDINTEVRHATNLGGKTQKIEVENWLKNVQQKRSEVQRIQERAGKRRYLSRLRFLRLVEKTIQEADELIEQGRFPEGLLIDVHQDKEDVLLTTPLVGQTMKERNMMQIWECLMKDDIHRIGVYGMGGVGKTSILIHIHNQILESTSTFDHAYWVTVSQESSIYKLQYDIAKVLDLDLSEDPDERRRASRLSKELTLRNKFVLILDDMWNALALENVGIPIGVNGGKLIISTRSLEVCRRMNCQQNLKVEPLPEEEARDLFREKLGHETLLAPEVEEIVNSVAKECAGLPLAIITTAGTMKGVNDIREWRNALKELRKPTKGIIDRENEVFKTLKFSYDRLNNDKLQQCLLYCALFPEDYMIKRVYLIMCWIAEGLIDEMETRQAEFDQGHSLLNKLENVCLLEPARDYNTVSVKMHDVIRDMALTITRVNSLFMVKAGIQLTEVPDESEWSENLDRVSLMHNEMKQLSRISPKCPNLRTLLLQSNPILFEIPYSLFEHMQSLRVLDLSDLKNEHLPDSISELENLRTLLLNRCFNLTYVPSLAKLTKLKELYLVGAKIRNLPDGMEKLVNLKSLAIYSRYEWFFKQKSELPNLSQLQSLLCSVIHNDIQLEALIGLKRLEFLYVPFDTLRQFNSYVKSRHWQSLTCYSLEVGSTNFVYSSDKCFSRQAMITDSNIVREEGSLKLPNNLLELTIKKCNDLISLTDISSSLKIAKELKRCHIDACKKMESIWTYSTSLFEEEGSEWCSNSDASILKSLRTLNLIFLPNLSFIFNFNKLGGPPPKCGIFSNLKLLRVTHCGKLKYVFTHGLVQHHLQNLEVIDVFDCVEMEKIIHAAEEEEEEEEGTDERNYHSNNHEYIITCPKLHTLELRYLPKLKSIWSGIMVCHSLQQIGVGKCPVLDRLPFSAHLNNVDAQTSSSTMPILRKISGNQKWWDLLEWDHPDTKSILEPLFDAGETTLLTFAELDALWRKDAEQYEML